MSQAGWSQVEITPPLGLPMGGRGPRFAPGASVVDPLFGQALIIEDTNRQRLVFVSVDLVNLDASLVVRIRQAVSMVTGARPECVLVNCSHTHSGPLMTMQTYATDTPKPADLMAYEDSLIVSLQQAARAAANDMASATIRWRNGLCDVGINRRRMNNGQIINAPNPSGPYNPDLWVLDIAAEHKRAVVFSYACHPIMRYTYIWDGISADWPGAAKGKLTDALGSTTHVQFLQALAGDIRPRILADLEAGRFRKATDEDIDAVGDEMAQAVLGVLEADDAQPIEPALATSEGHAMLGCDPGQPADHWRAQLDDEQEIVRQTSAYWLRRMETGAAPNTHTPWQVGLVRLSPRHLIVWFGGEPLSAWLSFLRNQFPDQQVWAIGYTGASQGYLPMDENLEAGGYEVTSARQYALFGPGTLKPGIDRTMEGQFSLLGSKLDR